MADRQGHGPHGGRGALRHSAFVYGSEAEYVERVVPFLREGLEAGEGAVVANAGDGIAAMRDALGADAERVRFVDVRGAYTRPARTLAAYHEVFVEQLAATPRLRAMADVQWGPEEGEWDLWTAYEAVFNLSFEHLPAWVLCSYDTDGLPDPVLEGVRRTHPEVVDVAGWSESAAFGDPRSLLRGLRRGGAAPGGLRSLAVGGAGVDDPEALPEALARELVATGAPESKVLDLLLAADEVAANARTYGGGVAAVRTGTVEGRFVCEVVDRGPGFDDPAAGFLAPRPGRGTGLWVARQLTWDIEFVRAADGFTARIWL
ncbi:MAG TPA: sensor histidine kinase [Solirubrobacterales bacterium]|nr:sensor histidine kinase [Solirubrobacterales bacterium]